MVEDADDPTALPRVRRNVLADDVYDLLRDSLTSQRIPPGARLNLDQLAREMHVSNTPVRQALARLESEGLVTKEPYRGFAASRLLDSRTIVELYEYRLLIEPATAARAARIRADAGAAALEVLCEEASPLVDSDPDQLLPQRDVDFHLGVAGLATNGIVVENLSAMLTRMRLYSVYGHSGAAAQAWQEHRLITQAIHDHDEDGAARAMRAHLTQGLDRIRKAVT